ncbi:hypothetical protein [Peribacillus loiseleuriae]|uniref:hypothetical protein n=1 Tax=Peribacillus loiseleuriae TaxID=1679170 RepID=UPI003D04F4DE
MIAGCLALFAIFLFDEGASYYNVRFDEYLYIVFNGHFIDKVKTTEESNKYAYLFMGLSLIPTSFSYFCFRKFLKLVPEVD